MADTLGTDAASGIGVAPVTGGFAASVREQLLRIPVAMFGISTALGGLGAAWRQMHLRYDAPLWVSEGLVYAALAILGVLGVAYLTKAIVSPSAIGEDFKNPVASSLFGLIPLSMLTVTSSINGQAPVFADALWFGGTVLILAWTFVMTIRWLGGPQVPAVAAPAWIVTTCGALNVPLAVPVLHLDGVHGLSMFAFGIGIMYSLPVFTLIFSRLLFQAPLPEAMRPALMILTAPFSIGFSAYITLSGQNDIFAQSMFMMDIFLTAAVFVLLRHLGHCCPFRTSWWSVGFPLAATTNAAFRYAGDVHHPVADAMVLFMIAVTTIILAWLFCRTLFGILTGELKTIVT